MTLDDDVFEAAQAQAHASGMTLGQVLSHLARRGLRAERQDTTSDGLPVFIVPPDADIIPSDRARKLIEEVAT